MTGKSDSGSLQKADDKNSKRKEKSEISKSNIEESCQSKAPSSLKSDSSNQSELSKIIHKNSELLHKVFEKCQANPNDWAQCAAVYIEDSQSSHGIAANSELKSVISKDGSKSKKDKEMSNKGSDKFVTAKSSKCVDSKLRSKESGSQVKSKSTDDTSATKSRTNKAK